jgi:hypothetical protein
MTFLLYNYYVQLCRINHYQAGAEPMTGIGGQERVLRKPFYIAELQTTN